jgi:hypothetical protein
MPSKAEECLQKALECDEKARAAENDNIVTSFRGLAERWRILAKIVSDKSDGQKERTENKAKERLRVESRLS